MFISNRIKIGVTVLCELLLNPIMKRKYSLKQTIAYFRVFPSKKIVADQNERYFLICVIIF